MTPRFLPLEIFGVLEGLLIVSLIYAPAPWLMGAGGYTVPVILASMILGVVLSFAAFANGVLGWIGFPAHLGVMLGCGLFCLAASAFLLDAMPLPRAIFLGYGLLMTCGSLFVALPAAKAESRSESEPLADERFRRAA